MEFNGRMKIAGFTLVEIMIAMGLIGVLALVFANQMNHQMKASNTITVLGAYNDLGREAELLLNQGLQCSCQVRNLSFDSSVATAEVDLATPLQIYRNPFPNCLQPVNPPVAQIQPIGSKMAVTRVFLSNFTASGPNIYMAKLNLTVDSGSNTVGTRVRTRSIPVVLSTSPGAGTNQNIVNCYETGKVLTRVLDVSNGDTIGGAGSTHVIFQGPYSAMTLANCAIQVFYAPRATYANVNDFNFGITLPAIQDAQAWGRVGSGGNHNQQTSQYNFVFRARPLAAQNRWTVDAYITVIDSESHGNWTSRQFGAYAKAMVVCAN